MKNIFKSYLEIATSFFASIIIAVIIAVLLDYYFAISTFEAMLFGLLTFVALTIIQTQYSTARLVEKQENEQVLWSIQNTLDVKLSNIREAYRKLLKSGRDGPDLFQFFYDEKISELEKSILDASERDELQIGTGDLIRSSNILTIFKGEGSDIIRDVSFFDDNENLFSVYSMQYFYNVYKLVQGGKINQVKRLLIFSTEDQLQDLNSQDFRSLTGIAKNHRHMWQ